VAPQDGEVGQSITFDASNSRASDQIVSYAWQLGDGLTANAVIINHTYQSAGTYNVILTVTDGSGLTDTTTHLIQIREAAPPDTPEPEPEQPPTAIITEPEQVVAGQPATFDGSSSQPGSSPIVSYTWDFGDLSPPAGGITLQHTYAAPGSYLVTLQVTDENGETNSARVRLRVSQAEEAPQ
jgi:PKD repeat protein